MSNNKSVVCHFTVEELRYFNHLMVRERYLCGHVMKSIEDLRSLGVRLEHLDEPSPIVGKLLSYIKKGEQENE